MCLNRRMTWQVHAGLMLVVMSSEPGAYPFSEVRFSFDFVGYLAGSTVLALLLHLLVRRPVGMLSRCRCQVLGGRRLYHFGYHAACSDVDVRCRVE